jgi:hypothetical protein
MELEEKVLRYKLTLKVLPQLEWSWQEATNRGGMECTILAHIDTGTSALNIQNKRHLHWKELELIPDMNNDVEFAAPTHSLLMKTEAGNSTCQESKNRMASIQASPQAARKKRFTKLDISALVNTRMDDAASTRAGRESHDGDQEPPAMRQRTDLGINRSPSCSKSPQL